MLLKQWPRIRRRHRQDLIELESTFFDDPQRLIRACVEPEFQRTAPSRDHAQLAKVFRQPVREWLNGFLLGDFFQRDGHHILFVLGDAGAGKSALLMLLKLSHLARFWPPGLNFVLRKLGRETVSELGGIDDPDSTVLLLDALDQDPLAYEDAEARLGDLLPRVHPFRRVVITCRPDVLPLAAPSRESSRLPDEEIALLDQRCSRIFLSPFSDEQARAYLDRRFARRPGDRVKSWFSNAGSQERRKAGRLLRDIPEARRRPLFLRHIDFLSRAHIDQRNEAALYRALIDGWIAQLNDRRPEITREALETAVQQLALARHQDSSALEDELDKNVAAHLFVDAIRQHSLLARDTDSRCQFAEPSLIDFLVALSIIEQDPKAPAEPVRATATMIGFLGDWLRRNLRSNPWRRLDLSGLRRLDVDLSGLDLRQLPLPRFLRGADLASADLRGADLRGADLREADLRGADLREADLRGADLRGAQIDGTRLAGVRLDGGRIDPLIKNGIEMVLVPGGGPSTAAESRDEEGSVLAPFWIGRFPITNAQYQRFLQARPEQPRPEYWTDKDFNHPDQPVVGLSWLEATAFCRWAGFELPSEAQWVAAARGWDGRAYPWGDQEPDAEKAKFEADGPPKPTPVGGHPRGRGPYGTDDQAGNVWEWCRDVFEDPAALGAGREAESWWPGSDRKREGLYALRGGAWDAPAALLRIDFRNGQPAWFKGPNIGFRVVFQSAAESVIDAPPTVAEGIPAREEDAS